MKYIVIILAIIGGVILGYIAPEIPYTYYDFTAVAILATLDSLFGGLAALAKKSFNMPVFITGFFGNAIIAIGLVVLGNKLGVNIYFAAIIVFVQRILINFAVIRRQAIIKEEIKEAEVEE